MDKGIIVAVVVILAILVGLPIVGQVLKDQKADKAAVAAAAEKPAAPKPAPKQAAKPKTSITPPKPAQAQGQTVAIPGKPGQTVQLPPGLKPGEAYRVSQVQNAPPPQLNAQNLIGSKWSIAGGSLELLPNGMAIARHPQMPPELKAQGFPGNWSIHGNYIRLQAMGYIIEAQIVGKQIMGPEGPLRRLK